MTDNYYEIRTELRKITHKDNGEFISAEELGQSERILFETDNQRIVYEVLKQLHKYVKGLGVAERVRC